MIPKIIHYTWFSNDEYPDKIKKCIESWRLVMSDYEYILWDMNRIKDIDIPFLQEALSEKKWAFASDYIRLYAIYHYGGIYLDTDVIVHQSFDSLLSNRFFIGKEYSFHIHGHDTCNYLSSHCFGGEANHPFINDCLAYYSSIHFILTGNTRFPVELRYNMNLQPYIQAIIASMYGYDWKTSRRNIQKLENDIIVYPSEYFDSVSSAKTNNPYCTHLAVGAWRESPLYSPKITWKYKISWRIISIVEKILNRFSYTMIKLT